MLVDELQLPRDLSRSPLFDVMLISQTPAGDGGNTSSRLNMKSMEFEYPISKFDLSISYYEDENNINYFFEYNTALFREERIKKMFDHFRALVKSVLDNDKTSISGLNLISYKEKELLFNLFQGTIKKFEHNSIVDIIEKQTAENCNSTAVTYKRIKLTYKELNSRSNQLARYLLEVKKIKPGDYIYVMLDRSEWPVISMLAILKAGGVYIPVDSNYPQSRINFIFEDCGGKILIT
jgi:tyrocidine synthetase-3